MDTLRDAPEIFPAFEQLLDARNIPAKAKPYYLRWAKPIFYSLKNGGVDHQRIAKARQGCGEAASRIVGGRPAPAARMAGRASPQRVLRKMKLWP